MVHYENKYCRIITIGTYYVLQSKSAKYNDQYFATLTEARRKAGLPTEEQTEFLARLNFTGKIG